ncbi:MAG: SMP-30/gluconolactonase/LRE family protein, partial [Acidimicrobiales bacterium]
MSSSSFSTRHRRRASIVATVIALLATLISASPASASFTGNEPITTIAGNGSDGFSGDNGPATDATLRYPSGVAVDNDGNLYIADTINQRIRRIDAATGTIATIAGTGTAGFSGDNGPATNAELRNPHGVAVDSDDNVYIADTDNDRIRRIDAANGTITTIAGDGNGMYGGDGGPATNASMSSPYDVAVDDGGNVYIADALNSRIRRIDTTGTITTIAGSGSNGMGGGFGGDNGPATDATVFLPQSVAVDDDGNVYIADTFNHRIRRIDAATGIITTIAG